MVLSHLAKLQALGLRVFGAVEVDVLGLCIFPPILGDHKHTQSVLHVTRCVLKILCSTGCGLVHTGWRLPEDGSLLLQEG